MPKSTMNVIRQLLTDEGHTKDTLQKVEKKLLSLAIEGNFDRYRRAAPGEELCHKLDVSLPDSPALYLVSDGFGVVSPPHSHGTWAVIVGMEGSEMNQIYRVLNPTRKEVEQIDVNTVGWRNSIIMSQTDVHGTVSVGPRATFHLHLYGVDLASLPSISDRTYKAIPVTHLN
jgi:hypothetical protein